MVDLNSSTDFTPEGFFQSEWEEDGLEDAEEDDVSFVYCCISTSLL